MKLGKVLKKCVLKFGSQEFSILASFVITLCLSVFLHIASLFSKKWKPFVIAFIAVILLSLKFQMVVWGSQFV